MDTIRYPLFLPGFTQNEFTGLDSESPVLNFKVNPFVISQVICRQMHMATVRHIFAAFHCNYAIK